MIDLVYVGDGGMIAFAETILNGHPRDNDWFLPHVGNGCMVAVAESVDVFPQKRTIQTVYLTRNSG